MCCWHPDIYGVTHSRVPSPPRSRMLLGCQLCKDFLVKEFFLSLTCVSHYYDPTANRYLFSNILSGTLPDSLLMMSKLSLLYEHILRSLAISLWLSVFLSFFLSLTLSLSILYDDSGLSWAIGSQGRSPHSPHSHRSNHCWIFPFSLQEAFEINIGYFFLGRSLNQNLFSGTIPPSIWEMPNLQQLYPIDSNGKRHSGIHVFVFRWLNTNRLNGTIPAPTMENTFLDAL